MLFFPYLLMGKLRQRAESTICHVLFKGAWASGSMGGLTLW